MIREDAMPAQWFNGENELVSLTGIRVKIEAVQHEMVKDKEGVAKQKFVVRFEDWDPGLILNKTNADVLFDGLAKNTADWIGKEVILFRQHGEAFGKTQLMIRLRLVDAPVQQSLPTA